MLRKVMAWMLTVAMLLTSFPALAEDAAPSGSVVFATGTDVDKDVDTDAEPDVDADVDTDVDADVDTDVDADTDTEPDAEPDADATEPPEETPVPDPLEIGVSAGVRSAFVGDPIAVILTAMGGMGALTVVYQVNGEATDSKSVAAGADTYTFTPAAYGEYTVRAVVSDEAGQTAEASVTVPVAEHDTTSLEAWTNKAKTVVLTQDWRTDLVAVAKTQLGYQESATDFVVLEDGYHHYTIYGAKYGAAYASWSAAFVAYCAELAEIPAGYISRTADVAAMLSAVKSAGAFESDAAYVPSAGDLVFFKNEEGHVERVGVVTSGTESGLYTIEGGQSAVASHGYSLNDPSIMGYANMRTLMLRAGVLQLDALEAVSTLGVKSAFVGDEVTVTLDVAGGEGALEASYQMAVDGEQILAEADQESVVEGENLYAFTPMVMGDYEIVAVVTDEAEQTVETVVTLPVAEHDTTSLAEWTARAEAVALTGDWRADVVAVAQTQIGYTESETDFIILDDDSRYNYSVYGDWYGTNYQEWNAEFVSFALAYAAIPASAIPQAASAAVMQSAAQSAGVYRDAAYAPSVGDLAFFEDDRVAIVTAASESGIQVIEGNSEGAVASVSYGLGEVAGYADMYDIMVMAGAEDAVAIITGSDGVMKDRYDSLQAAVNAAVAGDTITLNQNVNESISSSGRSYTLDLSDHTITGTSGSVYTITGGTVTLTGGTITGGNATNGGGMNISGSAVVTLDGMTIDGNTATTNGGGIYINNATLQALGEKSTVNGNTAKQGGGIYAAGTAKVKMTKVDVSKNSATRTGNYNDYDHDDGYFFGGGGMYVATGADVELNSVKLSGNSGWMGSALLIYGTLRANECEISSNPGILPFSGSVIALNNSSYTEMTECDIVNNISDDTESIIDAYLSTLKLKNSKINNNMAQSVGGIYAAGCTLSIDECEITKNATGDSAGLTLGEMAGAMITTSTTSTITNTLIAGNTATCPQSAIQTTGGVSFRPGGRGGTMTLSNSVITDNHTTGNGRSPGGVWIGGTGFTMKEGSAIYGNTSKSTEYDAQDIYISSNAKPTLLKAAEMKDAHNKLDDDFFAAYVWRNVDTNGVETYPNAEMIASSGEYYLTAYREIIRNIAEYNGERFRSIQDALEKAKADAISGTAVITLVAGDPNDPAEEDKGNFAFTTDTVEIDIPVEINLNGRSVNQKDSVTDDILFRIVDGGSLKLTGAGVIAGGIDVQNANQLVLSASVGDVTVKLGTQALDADQPDTPAIRVEDGFACSGKLTIQLDEQIMEKLLAFNYGAEATAYSVALIADNGGQITPDQVYVAGSDANPLLVIKYDDADNIIIVNEPIVGLFVAGDGNDNNAGTMQAPFATVSHALQEAKNLGLDTIYIIDGKGLKVTADETWTSTSPVTIARFAEDDTMGAAALITVSNKVTLTVGNGITIDGMSYVNGRRAYTNCGSLIKVESESKLSITDNAVLRNNDISDTNSGFGGAVHSTGAVELLGGTIEDCAARFGGGICIEGKNASLNMSSGSTIKNNVAKGSGAGFGGGVFVCGEATMTMTGGEISNNRTQNGDGGGVALGGPSMLYGNPNKVHVGLKMSGGSFVDNTSSLGGGGLFIQCTFKAEITGGSFRNNHSLNTNFGGGAIYVNGGRTTSDGGPYYEPDPSALDGELYISSALITGNSAAYGGGGIAGCNTSSVTIHNGSSYIYDNTSQGGRADDIVIATHYEMESGAYNTFSDLCEFMLDGTPYLWKERGLDKLVTNELFAQRGLKRIYASARPELGTPKADVEIIGNTAASFLGGGIGTNGKVVIGESSTRVSFDVEKVWGDLQLADSLSQINIWAVGMKDGKAKLVTHNELFDRYYWKETVSFTNLDARYTYTVLEEAITSSGLHVWSAVSDANLVACVEAYMTAIGAAWIWSDAVDSPFIVKIAGDQNADFTITNTPVNLIVTKTVTGTGGDTSKSFTFTVTLNGASADITGTYGDMVFTGGKAVFTLKHGESKMAAGLPVGNNYTVVETDNDGYQVTATGSVGTVTAGQIARAAFINDREALGDLIVSKTVTGTAGDTAKEFTFTVTLSDKTISGVFGDMTFAGGVATFALRHGASVKAVGLPAGISYTVTEADNNGYTVTKTGDTGTITDGKTAEARFNNHQDATPTPTATAEPTDTPAPTATPELVYISIAGQKSWNDNDDEYGLRPESVVVRLVQNGVQIDERTVTAEDNWQYSFDQLPLWDEQGNEYVYSVSEKLVDGYYSRTIGYDLYNTLLPVDPTGEDEGHITPQGFALLRLTEGELADLLALVDYEMPLYGGLLGTGLEIPMYPFIFAGLGCLALLALLVTGRKKRKQRN